MNRRSFLGLAAAGLVAPLLPRPTSAAADRAMTVWKSPTCGCCGAWIEHVKKAGFDVRVIETDDLDPVKARHKVPERLQSCHTALVGGYAIEGHVPAKEILRLLAEKPAALGLAVPGMPVGSPGMEYGSEREPYEVVLFAADGAARVFARYS
jgi:hypothetical protein